MGALIGRISPMGQVPAAFQQLPKAPKNDARQGLTECPIHGGELVGRQCKRCGGWVCYRCGEMTWDGRYTCCGGPHGNPPRSSAFGVTAEDAVRALNAAGGIGKQPMPPPDTRPSRSIK